MTTWKNLTPPQSGPTCILEIYDASQEKHIFQIPAGCTAEIPDHFDSVVHHILIERAIRRSPDGIPGRLALKQLTNKENKT